MMKQKNPGRRSGLAGCSLIRTIAAVAGLLILGAPSSLQAAGKLCPEEKTQKSREGKNPINVSFINKTSSVIRKYWIDHEGKRKFYGELPPGATHHQETYTEHPWVMTNSQEDCVRFYRPAAYNHELVLD